MNDIWLNAVKRGDIDAVLALLESGANVDVRDRYGQTALMLAAHGGHSGIVETLIAYRADMNITAKFGLSALMLAIVAGHTDIACLLAKSGADLLLRGSGAPGFAGKTAYDLALERGMFETSAELKSAFDNRQQHEIRH
jgi:ankyrin repeat protein